MNNSDQPLRLKLSSTLQSELDAIDSRRTKAFKKKMRIDPAGLAEHIQNELIEGRLRDYDSALVTLETVDRDAILRDLAAHLPNEVDVISDAFEDLDLAELQNATLLYTFHSAREKELYDWVQQSRAENSDLSPSKEHRQIDQDRGIAESRRISDLNHRSKNRSIGNEHSRRRVIEYLREHPAMTAAEFARQCQITERTLLNVRTTGRASRSTYAAIADAMDVALEELFEP